MYFVIISVKYKEIFGAAQNYDENFIEQFSSPIFI